MIALAGRRRPASAGNHGREAGRAGRTAQMIAAAQQTWESAAGARSRWWRSLPRRSRVGGGFAKQRMVEREARSDSCRARLSLSQTMPRSRRPIFLFAHGAGAASSHPWMRRWAELLRAIGNVVAFDYLYLAEGRKRPDPLPKLIEAHRAALEDTRQSHAGPVVLIGKSMGGRVGCHLALQEAVTAVVCLGYPLCGGGDCSKLRDKVLRELRTPVLFVQGTRDSLCPLDVLARVRCEMRALNELHVVEGGDHSLLVTKSQLKASGETQDDADRRILQVIQKFVAEHSEAN